MAEMTPEEKEIQKAANRERSATYIKRKKGNRTAGQLPPPLHRPTMQAQGDEGIIVPVHSSVPISSHREHHPVSTVRTTTEVPRIKDVILPVIPVLAAVSIPVVPALPAALTASNTITLQYVSVQPPVLQISLWNQPNMTT